MTASLPEFSEVLDPLTKAARERGLVVFAGAGLSVPTPSALPGWRHLNTAFLDALCVRLAKFTDGEVGPGLLEWLVTRCDQNQVISPDFQAQLAEDECGVEYFRMFQVLDIDAWNTGHAAIAALAKAGVLRALITTNFDRLTEHALRKAEVEFRVFGDVADFEALEHFVANSTPEGNRVLPVIKAHGSVESPESMVDTLCQRMIGRPLALERAISQLLGRHASLVLGFSGADLAEPRTTSGWRRARGRAPFCSG